MGPVLLNTDIHRFVLNTKPFLTDIKELRYLPKKFDKKTFYWILKFIIHCMIMLLLGPQKVNLDTKSTTCPELFLHFPPYTPLCAETNFYISSMHTSTPFIQFQDKICYFTALCLSVIFLPFIIISLVQFTEIIYLLIHIS